MEATQTFFQTRDFQNLVIQFLPIDDIIQNYQLVSKNTYAVTKHADLWAMLLQRDFKLNANQLSVENEEANFLFYKVYYLETKFHFYGNVTLRLQSFKQAIDALTPCLKKESDWNQYFYLSLKLHESASQRSFFSKDTEQQIEKSFLQLLKTTDISVFVRLCWLFANRYWFFEHHYEPMLFKLLKRLDELSKQTKNETYYARSNMLYALYCIKQKADEEEFCETESDDDSGLTGADLYRSIYHALENKDTIFFPIVARLLFTTILDSWTFWMRLDYKTAIKQLYAHFTEELVNKPSFEDFLVNLYSKLAQCYEPFKAIIFPHLYKQTVQGNLNLVFERDYKAACKRLLEVMETHPKLFSYAILSKVQAAIQNSAITTEKEALNQKEALKALVNKMSDDNNEEKPQSFIRAIGQDDPYEVADLLYSLTKNTRHYRSDDDSDESDDYGNSFYKYAAMLQQREYEREYERERQSQMLETIANLLSQSRVPTPSFNENKAIEHINNTLGATFIKNYIVTQRGQWQVEKINNAYVVRLAGLQIAKKNDCDWYKAKLIKGGIQAKDIHFDLIKDTKSVGDKYRLRITNIQDITLEQTISSQPVKGLKY